MKIGEVTNSSSSASASKSKRRRVISDDDNEYHSPVSSSGEADGAAGTQRVTSFG